MIQLRSKLIFFSKHRFINFRFVRRSFFDFFVEFESFVVVSRYFSRIRFFDKIIILSIENNKVKINEIFITIEKNIQNFFFEF